MLKSVPKAKQKVVACKTNIFSKYPGSPVECQFWEGIPVTQVLSLFKEYQKADHEQLQYTDDTAMARQIGDSIIAMRSVDPKNLAERFVTEYVFIKMYSENVHLYFDTGTFKNHREVMAPAW